MLRGSLGGINPLSLRRVHTLQSTLRPQFPKVDYDVEKPRGKADAMETPTYGARLLNLIPTGSRTPISQGSLKIILTAKEDIP